MAEFLDPRRASLLMERITRGGTETSFKASTTQRASRSPPPHNNNVAAPAPFPPPANGQLPPNDGSNLSSAGSASDCGPDTPEKAHLNTVTAVVNSVASGSLSSASLLSAASQSFQPAASSSSRSAGGSEKKRRGKRKVTGDDDPTPKTPRSEKKMDEFVVRGVGRLKTAKSIGFVAGPAQTSQSAFPSTFTAATEFVPISPERSRDGDGENHRTTPTSLCPYPPSENSASNSNQSPSSVGVPGSNGQRLYGHCQTDLGMEGLRKIEREREESSRRADELASENTDLGNEVDGLRRALTDSEDQLSTRQRQLEEQDQQLVKSRDMMCKLLTEQSVMGRKQRRTKCMEDRLRLGQYTTERTMHQFQMLQEKWQEGYAFEELHKKLVTIKEEREEIEAATKILRKSRKPSTTAASRERQRALSQREGGVTLSEPASPGPSTSADENCFIKPENPREINPQDYHERDEIYRLRREQLKKEEADCQSELSRLERERQLHIREIKRIQNEDASKHKDHAVLHKRYLLLSLLGKGGFSEVWKSFDLEENRYVACKIHHVNKEWKEEKKANYVKHALREKDIHKTLVHPRIVSLYDVFTIDNHSFCTVLEYCDGNDLDFYLKQNKTIPEKEARSIIMQVINALKYLNDLNPSVIHYDLKPANILLSSGTSSGEIKITDFGLSKLLEQQDPDSPDEIELTSQGAGTYWYLPPECFVILPPGAQQSKPKISQKVDVWSVGVIFYQCLYGKRPFGDGQTQEGIMKEQTILKATEPDFPNKPSVSQEAKTFIRCCLQYRKEERADVAQLYNHEYLRPKSASRTSSTTPSRESRPPAPDPRTDSGAVSPQPT